MAANVGLGLVWHAPIAPRRSSTESPSTSTAFACNEITWVTAMPGSVSVPVLSTQMVSTRASTSTAGRSCTSTRRSASRITATAMAMLVSSTRPSGTIVTMPAMVPRSASFMGRSSRTVCEISSSTPTGTSR